MTNTVTKKGGARPGAGRPRTHTGPMRNITLYLPVDILDAIDQKSKDMGVNQSWAATRLLRTAIEDYK